MVREVDKYTYRVTWSEEDEEFIGLCAEFQSLSWLAETPEDALKGIRKIVRSCVKDMASGGEEWLVRQSKLLQKPKKLAKFKKHFTTAYGTLTGPTATSL